MKLACGLTSADLGCFSSENLWGCPCAGSVPLTEGEMEAERQRRAARRTCDGGSPETSAAFELFEAA